MVKLGDHIHGGGGIVAVILIDVGQLLAQNATGGIDLFHRQVNALEGALTGQGEVAGNGSAEAEYDLAVERTVIYFVFSGSRIGSLRSTRGCRGVVGCTGCYGKDHNQRQEQCG